jgi:hypothetical protein
LLASSQYNLYDIYLLLRVQYYTPDDGQRNCSKHVEFHSKNKFENLVHLVGFIIRIYHDARSSECQISTCCFDSDLSQICSSGWSPKLFLHIPLILHHNRKYFESNFLQDQIRRDTCSANDRLTHTEVLTFLCNSLILCYYTILSQQQAYNDNVSNSQNLKICNRSVVGRVT